MEFQFVKKGRIIMPPGQQQQRDIPPPAATSDDDPFAELELPEKTYVNQLECAVDILDTAKDAALEQLREFLAEDRGKQSFEENERDTKFIHKILLKTGKRLACPTCGEPSLVRCERSTATEKTTNIRFEHKAAETPSHSGFEVLPNVQIVDAPPDARKGPRKPRQSSTSTTEE
jgi:hypothetical protein